MTSAPPAPTHDHGRAGRNVPVSIASAVVLVAVILATLLIWKTAFMVVVAAAVVVAVWELHRGMAAKGIDVPEQPLMAGGVIMVVVAYFWGSPAYVQNATAAVFVLVYVPFLGSFVALLLREGGATDFTRYDAGVKGILTFIAVTAASDIGGFCAGVLFGKHPMAPVISPKKSWEGFAGSAFFCVAAGIALVVWLLDGDWWVGVVLGLIAVVMATLGDLVESVMKRDLGIKDMSQIIPGHGGLMDRIDSLLATIAPVWLLLHYLVFT
jgi:phosphatidate cytidylyltransferase